MATLIPRMRGGSAEPRTKVARARTGLIPLKSPHKLAYRVHIVYITNMIMKTKFTIPPKPFIRSRLAADIPIGDSNWTQPLVSISKNSNAYLNKKTLPDSICWVVPILCLGNHTCLPQDIKRSHFSSSRIDYECNPFLTFLQVVFLRSCSIGSVFRNSSFFKVLIHLRIKEITSQYLKEIQVTSWYLLFRKKPRNPI